MRRRFFDASVFHARVPREKASESAPRDDRASKHRPTRAERGRDRREVSRARPAPSTRRAEAGAVGREARGLGRRGHGAQRAEVAPPVLRVERADLAPHVAAVRDRGRDGPSVDRRDDAEGPGPVGGDDVAAQRGAGGVGALEAPGRRRRCAVEREGGGPRGLDEEPGLRATVAAREAVAGEGRRAAVLVRRQDARRRRRTAQRRRARAGGPRRQHDAGDGERANDGEQQPPRRRPTPGAAARQQRRRRIRAVAAAHDGLPKEAAAASRAVRLAPKLRISAWCREAMVNLPE